MEDEVEFSGRTVDDAVAQAVHGLNESRENLEIQVLTQGSRGVFGIGAEPARILVRRRPPAPVEPEISALPEPKPFGPSHFMASEEEPVAQDRHNGSAARTEQATSTAPAAVAAPPEDQETPRPRESSAELAAEAATVLRELLASMRIRAEVDVQSTENPVTLSVHGQNLGILIGRRGDNLSALQFMLNLILSKGRRQWPRVVLDVENYRARREDSLRTLADRVAYRVRRNGRAFTLEAMPASDRRIIHLALRDRSDVETYSIGEGPARRVVIAPKRASRPGMERR